MTEQVQPIVTLQFTPAGAELMLASLRKLTIEQGYDLFDQTRNQFIKEIERLNATQAPALEAE